jgi:hypothetical protein
MPIEQSEKLIDFGPGVPVAVSPEARLCLSRLPSPATGAVLGALRDWARNVPLKAARASVYTDREEPDWREVIIDLLVDCDADAAMSLWQQMEDELARVKASLDAADRTLLDHQLGVHMLWGADDWLDESTAV